MPTGPFSTDQNGTNSSEVMTGTADRDILRGAGGADTIYGGLGADYIQGDYNVPNNFLYLFSPTLPTSYIITSL